MGAPDHASVVSAHLDRAGFPEIHVRQSGSRVSVIIGAREVASRVCALLLGLGYLIDTQSQNGSTHLTVRPPLP